MPPENAPPSKPRPPAAPAPPAAAVPGAPLLVEQAITLLEHAKRMEPTDPQATLAAVRRVDDWLRAIVTTDNVHAAFGRRDGEWLSRYGVNLSVADSICHFVKSDMSVLAERTQIRLPNGGLWGKNIFGLRAAREYLRILNGELHPDQSSLVDIVAFYGQAGTMGPPDSTASTPAPGPNPPPSPLPPGVPPIPAEASQRSKQCGVAKPGLVPHLWELGAAHLGVHPSEVAG